MVRFNLILLLGLMILVSLAQAKTYLNVYLDESGDALFLGKTNDSSLQLPDSIKIKDGNIIGKTSEFTSKNDTLWTFSFFLPDSQMEVILPKDTIIKDASSREVAFFEDHTSVYAEGGVSISYSLLKNHPAYYIAAGIAIIILLMIYLILRSVIRSRYIHPHDSPLFNNMLNEREKTILSKLKNSKKIKMSYLRKQCDIPKASFSRHIQELEKKRLIKRWGHGKNKFIELAKV